MKLMKFSRNCRVWAWASASAPLLPLTAEEKEEFGAAMRATLAA